MKEAKWSDDYYVEVFELARTGMTNHAIAEILDVSYPTFKRWLRQKPALSRAVRRARNSKERPDKPATLAEYIYDQLPPDVQATWDSLKEFDRTKNAVRKMELLAKQPTKVRQMLLVHALVSGLYNLSAACKTAGVTKSQYEKWVYTDPEFTKLVDEVMWHKKNFYEASLNGLVAQGDASATLFVNKTINRDRGYNPDVTTNVNVSVLHGHIDLDQLSVEQRRELLKQAQKSRQTVQDDFVDVDAVPSNAKQIEVKE